MVGQHFPDYEDKKFLENFRVDKTTFAQLYVMFGPQIAKKDTKLRKSICGKKRMAIFLEWMAHAKPFHQLVVEYPIGTSTVHDIIHECLQCSKTLLSEVCKFPTGCELEKVMEDFESLCHLPGCGGALDGTLMKIQKLQQHGDTYYCYKG